jgi:glycosyltransferase involved in cell wall biosynthesis
MQISRAPWCERNFSEQKRISLLLRIAKHRKREEGRNMRIAQVAPLYESVPPKQYGGTERIVSYLTEELIRQGHDVTLFASGDSETAARLIPVCHRSLRLDERCMDQLAHHVLLLEQVSQRAHEFDLIHFHIDYLHFPVSRLLRIPHVTTLHGRLDIPDLAPLYNEFREMPVVSISNSQREPLPSANWQGTIYHGLPENLLRFQPEAGKYLAFLGRICPEKRVDRAIEIAKRTGIPLKIAAKVDPVDKRYFKRVIEPLLRDSSTAEWIGEISDRQKDEFLGNAYALLFPIDWPEPFGLVMIEAMACGTPVLGFRCGSVPEIIDDRLTGRVVATIDEAIRVLPEVIRLDRRAVRRRFEARFSAPRMANQYLDVYRAIRRGAKKPLLVQGDTALGPNVIALQRKNGVERHAT